MFYTSAVLLHEASLILKCPRVLTREAGEQSTKLHSSGGHHVTGSWGWRGGGRGGTSASAWLHKGT